MIESFGNRLAEDLFFDRQSRDTRRFPTELRRVARRKVLYLHDAAELGDLRVPPGNRLEALKGRLKGCTRYESMTSGASCFAGNMAVPLTWPWSITTESVEERG